MQHCRYSACDISTLCPTSCHVKFWHRQLHDLHACAILQKRGAELAAAKLLERKAAKAEGEEVLDAKPLSSTVAEVDGKPVLQSKS